MSIIKNYSRSKLYAWYIGIITTLLTAFAIYNKLEGVASAIFTSGFGFSVGLYANKQYQERKKQEIKKEK
jgi:hypothetical protein